MVLASRNPIIAASGAEARPAVVLQVVPRLEAGGVERGAVDIAAAIVEAGGVALVASAGGPMARDVERAGGRHIALPADSKNPLTMQANARRLRRILHRHGVDVVHARSRAPAWSALLATRPLLAARPLLATRQAPARFVTTFHGFYGASNRAKRLYNSVMARGERVIAISRFIGDHARAVYGLDPERLRIVPRGIDLEAFAPAAVSPDRIERLAGAWRLTDGAPVVMLPGRLTRWKGQHVLLEAFARLGRPDAHCLLVGGGKDRGRYRRDLLAQLSRAGIASSVRITGHCDDMPAAYMLADVVVSASIEAEAFGRVAAEAQAMGRPIVATDHGGARETVLPGRTGWLVAPGDPASMAAALDRALAMSAAQRETMARRAAAHVRANFTRERMCARTLDVYRELLRPPAAP